MHAGAEIRKCAFDRHTGDEFQEEALRIFIMNDKIKITCNFCFTQIFSHIHV